MGNNAPKEIKINGYTQPLIMTPTNNNPLEQINIDELILEFEHDPNKYKEYIKKLFYVFSRSKQCDSTVNIKINFIPNIKKLCLKILSQKKRRK